MNGSLMLGLCVMISGTPLPIEPPAGPERQHRTDERVELVIPEMPHVRVDRERGIVEFDGFVPIDAHIENAPHLYLEVMVCTPEVRAHESLVASRASPRHVHAALLLVGLIPGRTGAWHWNGAEVARVPPEGSPVEVRFIWTDADGQTHDTLASDWVVSRVSGIRLTETIEEGAPRWVFAGSRMVSRGGREWYAAEAEGTIVGLHTFTSETVAWSGVYSPSAEIEDPEWIADPSRVPPRGTSVVVRLIGVAPRASDLAE
ncbi:MAG: hypothetical protein KF902_10355 [Phycisphaeraceae bacterium]|nr:hypothetical protein [Phycisphaeraceae bacterium]